MKYRFLDCEIDTQRRVLERSGAPVPVQPKVFDLLDFLAMHRERVVTKEVLFRALWPDAFVSTAALTRVVKEARRAVGDDGRQQRVIRTVHGFGYQFAAAIETLGGREPSEAERAIEIARRSLEASLELGTLDLRSRVRDFAETCLAALQATESKATG